MSGGFSSLFSPAGKRAGRMRGDEGGFAASALGASRTFSSDLSGHLLPAGKKREPASCR